MFRRLDVDCRGNLTNHLFIYSSRISAPAEQEFLVKIAPNWDPRDSARLPDYLGPPSDGSRSGTETWTARSVVLLDESVAATATVPSERWSVDRRGRMEPTYGASGTREGDRKAPEPSVSGRVETRTSSDRS